MRRRHLRPAHFLVAAVLVVGAAACSDDDEGSAGEDTEAAVPAGDTTGDDTAAAGTAGADTTVPGSASGEDAEACEALRPVSEYDAQASELLTGGDWPAIQSFVVDSEDEVVAAYDSTAELVPDLADDLGALRDLTVDYTAAATEAADFETWSAELTSMISDNPDAAAAGAAVDTWATEHCGFSTGGG